MEFSQVVKKRRTHYDFSGKELSSADLRPLLEAAIQAPNHRRNQPWRFLLLEPAGIAKFWAEAEGNFFAEALSGREPEVIERKRKKLSARLPKVGAIVYVTCQRDEKEIVDEENYAATCCAVQNLMLAAADAGLGSFWSTGAVFSCSSARELLGIPAEERFVGAIWLGYPVTEPSPPVYDLDSTLRAWP